MFRFFPLLSHNTRASRARRWRHPFPHGFSTMSCPNACGLRLSNILIASLVGMFSTQVSAIFLYIILYILPSYLDRSRVLPALGQVNRVDISPGFLDLASLACPPALAFRLTLSCRPPPILCPSLVSGLSVCRRADGSSSRKVVWLHHEESLSYLPDE